MYALFVETAAYAQCVRAGIKSGMSPEETEELAKKCWINSCEYIQTTIKETPDHWWVNKALAFNHRHLDVNALFNWSHTPEGQQFWASVWAKSR